MHLTWPTRPLLWLMRMPAGEVHLGLQMALRQLRTRFAPPLSYGNMIIVPTYTPGCVYNLRHTSMDAALPVNSDSLGGWIFGEADYAVQNSYPTCIQSMASFNHVFMIVGALSAPWAGLGFQPGSRFVIQVHYQSAMKRPTRHAHLRCADSRSFAGWLW